MTIEQDLVSFFASTVYAAQSIAPKVSNRIHVGKVPKSQRNVFPRLYLDRGNKETIANLDGSGTNDFADEDFNLEVISDKTSDVSAITQLLWDDVHCHLGLITATKSVKGILISNQDDDYEPKGIGSDLGLDLATFALRIVHSST